MNLGVLEKAEIGMYFARTQKKGGGGQHRVNPTHLMPNIFVQFSSRSRDNPLCENPPSHKQVGLKKSQLYNKIPMRRKGLS